MYWTLNKKTKAPGFHTSMKKIADHTGIKYDKISYELGVKDNYEFETDDFFVSKTSSIESAMIAFSEKIKSPGSENEMDLIGSKSIEGVDCEFYVKTPKV